MKAFSIFELRFLFRTEDAVAGVAEAGDDVAMLVQLFIDCAAVEFDIGMFVRDQLDALGSSNEDP